MPDLDVYRTIFEGLNHMGLEDDIWSLDHLVDCDDNESAFGVGSFRQADEHGVVHRVTWTRAARGWAPICGFQMKVDTEKTPRDPGAVTCLQCVSAGG